MAALDKDVKDYEPALALDGGEDGLDFYRSVITKWKKILKENGYMVFECGINQWESVAALMEENGFTDIIAQKDTLGIDRVISGRIARQLNY